MDNSSRTTSVIRTVSFLGAASLLAGCANGLPDSLSFLKPEPKAEATRAAPIDETLPSLGQRDVEAPEIFSANETALWDGRPSFGGIWVAAPGVKDPERVIIRNKVNGKSITGALFRRERDNPGPRLQMSSDAAEALGVLAGQPTQISVVALRKEDIPAPVATSTPVEAEDIAAAPADLSADQDLATASPELLSVPVAVTTAPLDPVDVATAAIDRAEDRVDAPVAQSAPAPVLPADQPLPDDNELASLGEPLPLPEPAATSAATKRLNPLTNMFGVKKPFIQVGTFTIKDAADAAAARLREGGILPTVKEQTGLNNTFYRVLVGPSTQRSERRELQKSVQALGFRDSYYVEG